MVRNFVTKAQPPRSTRAPSVRKPFGDPHEEHQKPTAMISPVVEFPMVLKVSNCCAVREWDGSDYNFECIAKISILSRTH